MKLEVLAGGTVGAMVVWFPMFGAGVANADDYAGQTYGDASSALSDAKLKGVIATRTGDTLPNDNCIVTHSEKSSWIKGDKFGVDRGRQRESAPAPVAPKQPKHHLG